MPAPAPVALDDSAQGEELDQPAADVEESGAMRGGWLGKVGYVVLGAFLAVVVGLAVQRRLLLR